MPSMLDGCWMQRHIYPHMGPFHAPYLDVWTLSDEHGWQQHRVYMHPVHVALVEMSRRFVTCYQPAEWYF